MQLPKVKVQPVRHPSLPYRLAPEAVSGVLASDAGAPLSGAGRWM